MLSFEVDVSSFAQNRGLDGVTSNLLASAILSNICLQFQRDLYTLIDTNLKSTRATYKSGVIHFMSPSGTEAGFELEGNLPNKIEQGFPAYDLKNSILNGRGRRLSKDGKAYAFIPFRFGTGLAENEAFSAKLPNDIYNIAKKLESESGQLSKGRSLKNSTVKQLGYFEATRAAVSSPYLTKEQSAAYTHKTSIYAGIYKERKKYNVATQSKYVSFRAVSENSPSNAFIHPGFKAANLFQKALDLIEPAIEGITIKQIKNILGNDFNF